MADAARYFWYKKAFVLKQLNPKHILLQINKAAYRSQLLVNRKPASIHHIIFSSYETNITTLLKPAGQENELVLRSGIFDNYPDTAMILKK